MQLMAQFLVVEGLFSGVDPVCGRSVFSETSQPPFTYAHHNGSALLAMIDPTP